MAFLVAHCAAFRASLQPATSGGRAFAVGQELQWRLAWRSARPRRGGLRGLYLAGFSDLSEPARGRGGG
eukprot:7203367-Lingulodinium_polyedra.AAC.1